MFNPPSRSEILWRYLALSYLFMLINMLGYLRHVICPDATTAAFVAVVYLTYGLMYLLPVFTVAALLNALVSWRRLDRVFGGREKLRGAIVFTVAWAGFSLSQVLIFADRFIFAMFGFHINGFVWNLVTTKGGIDSMGGGGSTTVTFALIIASICAIQLALLLVLKIPRVLGLWRWLVPRRVAVTLLVMALLLSGAERVAYGYSNARNHFDVTQAAYAFPFYQPTRFRKLAKQLGFLAPREVAFDMKVRNSQLQYPRRPIERTEHKKYNIVWLVVESLRADMLDAEIMPSAHAFSERATRMMHHYSGGNGTRMGVFSLFYGIYGNYWFPLLDQRRGPIVMDLILEDGYQYEMYTSAKFSYPEFDSTIFARIPAEHLHETTGKRGWEEDRMHVTSMLNFIEKRDSARPFMTFMFFESPHSNYFFPEEAVIRPDYLPDLNYATMDLERDLPRIKNRYINAVHHLDDQLGRVIDYLEKKRLLDSTIVIITGDHGEEFMEKGRWGHNSAFTEEQIRVPFVLWVPGREPAKVMRMTSHLDLPATLLPLMGVRNPAEDYSQGLDMLGAKAHPYVVISDWQSVCYVDYDYKAVFALNASRMGRQTVTTRDDGKVEDKTVFYETHQARLTELMKALGSFGR